EGSWALTVEAAPTNITLTASSTTVCAGTPVTLTASATGAASYSFNGGNNWQAGSTAIVTVNSDTTFTVKARSALGCESAEATTTVYLNDITMLVIDAPPHCTNQYACTLTFSGWTATPGWEIEYGHGNTIGSNILGSTTAESITCMSPGTMTLSLHYFWARTKNNTCTGTAQTASYLSCLCAPISYSCCQTCGVVAQWSYYYGTLGGVCGCTQTNGSMDNITGCIVETIIANGTSWRHCHHTDYGPVYWNKQGNICR
ncbi:MAG: hypothetical protein LBD91_03340, partial [Prevotellaceae bacterium]|nr:hypothetical protein [Prevotellaceae bacterium]